MNKRGYIKIAKRIIPAGSFLIVLLFFIGFAGANNYTADVYFTLPNTVYITNEMISFKGFLYQANYTNNGTLISSLSPINGNSINFTINNNTGGMIFNHTFTTDVNGSFYSNSTFRKTARTISAPSSSGEYFLRTEYTDPGNKTWFTESKIMVVNQTLDSLHISTEKVKYFTSENVKIRIEAIKLIEDKILFVANTSVNGTLRNMTKSVISSFNCSTGNEGKCTISITAPTTVGKYYVELNNFTAFSSFLVVPFSVSVYMKDELGKSLKNVYGQGEKASVEVKVSNASTSDVYTFSGYIADSSGNVVKSISTTTLNSNNSFTNTFTFDVDSLTFNYGSYLASVTVTRSGGGSITLATAFEVKGWNFLISKKEVGSGFEYGFSAYPNKTLRLEAYPKLRLNGTIISNINSSSFDISLKDELGYTVYVSNATWNASCSKSGCYEFLITSPLTTGNYKLEISISHEGITQTQKRTLNVISGLLAVQSTNKEGVLKELFGTNEFVYLKLEASNATSKYNLSDAEVFSIVYMNGSEISYTKVDNFTLVNATNSVNEWAWNITLQMLKLDVPKFGGVYNAFIFGDNKTVGALARFIARPYESCTVAKDTAGTVGSGNYYVWQFKTSDTIYFEVKIIQANNPTGRASASNFSSGNDTGSSYGQSSACNVDTTKQQVINNATLTVVEVRNSETGNLQNINASDTTCQSSDSSGGYTCTAKPLTNWEGGNNVVKFKIIGPDGTEDFAYGRFEARAFYLYGWSSNWQNNPGSNITLNVRLYEAGSGWWGSGGGLSGTITLKRVEYMGSDGDWVWPPVDSGYNASNVSSASVTSGSGTLNLPTSAAANGKWKSGYYRAVIQGTTSGGDTDYGYAWFGVKLWDVYGSPVDCTSTRCDYKNYFNSKENITLYIKISQAGSWSYNYAGGEYIYGNVSIGVKKISDCRSWPCKELNSSQYAATTIYVNSSSPWYWSANLTSGAAYLLKINTTFGSWGTGYYSVTLDVNGTDTGNAWFNTIAFYVDARPTDENASNNWKTNIKTRESMYYNITATKNYKGWNVAYNTSDFINATIDDAVLRVWDSSTYESKEFNYPGDINISIINRSDLQINGSAHINISYNNGSWPTGYYWGELILRNIENETSSAWLWFSVQPFRVAVSTNTYNVASEQCVNASINIYEPFWYSNQLLTSNYSILEIYENIWNGNSQSRTSYTNFTNSSFTASQNITVCPNNADWGGGSWGGYHYLNIKVRDNTDNSTQEGWLSFKSVPFSVTWGSVQGGTGKLTNAAVSVQAGVTNPLTGVITSGNLSKIYQWRWDNNFNGEETFVFKVGNCWSNVSGQCNVTGYQNITIYPNTRGWRLGYNYLQSEWNKITSSASKVQDWSGIYIEGRESYNGYFSNSDSNGNYKYDFATNENITIKVNIWNSSYSSVNANISSVQYALSGGTCYSDWCLSYTSATWGIVGGGTQTSNGNAILTLRTPSAGWTNGDYYIKVGVSGSDGTGTITGGRVRVKDLVAPNITITSPANLQNITTSTFGFSATTTENAQCSLALNNYNNFYNYYCGNVNENSNNGSLTAQKIAACNLSQYTYNGTTYYYEYTSPNYRSIGNGSNYYYSSASTGFTTGGTNHTYTYNVSNWSIQNYGIYVWCYDSDYNYASEVVAFNVTKGT